MGMGGGGGTTTTVKEKPSPLEEQRAEMARRIGPVLESLVTPGLTGIPTPGRRAATGLASQQFRSQLGQMGVQPGDPRMAEGMRRITETLTKPDRELLETALALYTGLPAVGGEIIQETGQETPWWHWPAQGVLPTAMGMQPAESIMLAATLAAALCLPENTFIETINGAIPIQLINIGDEVIGGKVIDISRIPITSKHIFYEYKFKNGKVIASYGHPFKDKIISITPTMTKSNFTYDILTTSGEYKINNVWVKSTLEKLREAVNA